MGIDMLDSVSKGINTFNLVSKISKSVSAIKTISYAIISAIIVINLIDIMRNLK